MKRTLPFSLAALALILTLALALSLSFTPTLAQDDATPTPDAAGEEVDTGEMTDDTRDDAGDMEGETGDMGAQPGGPTFIGGAESSPAVQTVLNYFQTFDPNLLAENVQYRDFTQQQGLMTREDVTGAANYLNTAFTDQSFTVQRVLTAENTVVVEFDFSGTNTGAFMGAEPTQQTVTVPMVAIIELSDQAGMGEPMGETDEATEGAEGAEDAEGAEGAETEQMDQTDQAAQAAQQIVRFDLYYDASLLAQQLGFSLQSPGAGDVGTQPGDVSGETGDTGEDMTGDTGDMGAEDDTEDAGEDMTGEDATGLAPSITADDQAIAGDGTVTIAQVTSPVSGWVDIHADDSGAPGTIIGYAQIAPGETLNVPVPVDGNQVTGTLWAMLHEDAGEPGVHEFPGPDAPVTDAQGNVVVVPFSVTTEGDDAAQGDDAGTDETEGAEDNEGESAEGTEGESVEDAEGAGS